jgi:hypothetical protein
MTKRIQFTNEQLDYLVAVVEKRVVTPSTSPENELLNKYQQDILDKLYDGYEYSDDTGEIIR